MGKSDLIDKINARLKSQTAQAAKPALRPKLEEREDAGSEPAEKRITNSRTGTVVVRRRTPPRPEGEAAPMVTSGGGAGGAQSAQVDEMPLSAEPQLAVSDSAPVAVQSAVEVDESPAPAEVAPTTAAPVQVESAPSSGGDDAPVAVEAPVAVVSEPQDSPIADAAGPADDGAGAPRRSIEDVLARERGHVPQQRHAMIVGDGRNMLSRPEARPPVPPAGAATAAGQAANALRRPPQTATAIKELVKEDRRTEKVVARVVTPGKAAPPSRTLTREEEDRIRNASKVRKAAGKKKEVVQRRDVATELEPQFRKQRRMAAKKEKAKPKITVPKAIKRVIRIEDTILVGELAHRMGIKATAIIKKLMGLGVMATINQAIDHDTASLVAADFSYEVENVAFDEVKVLAEETDAPELLIKRPPVVTVMGHVDHGKTTLLDAIRNADVAGGEAGGITQHIGAYTIDTPTGKIVFLDTPGHEAFTAMRARGAQVTDIVILVVAADDGVMPQTVEALNHAKEAKVPIIVAVNKVDKPDANPSRIREKLSEYGLVSEEWGGTTIFQDVSAKKRLGIDELLEYILLQSEVLELKANPNRAARATVVESQLDKGRGPVATVLIINGTLRVGDTVVVGAQYGKIRAMVDDKGKAVKEAGPSMPVEILGLSGVPDAGDGLNVVDDLDKARSIAENRSEKAREQSLSKSARVSLEDLFNQIQRNEVKELKLILKTDVQGSLEAFEKSISELSTESVKTNVLHSAVGSISEGDVMLASASKAIIVGFNAKPDPKAAALAEQEGIQIRTYSIIYEALDELRLAMQGLLKPVLREKVLGHAEVRATFGTSKSGLVAGSFIIDGKVTRGAMARLMRAGKSVWEGKMSSLRRFKEDVREVDKGYECGIGLEGYNDVKVGDVIEAYVIEEFRPNL